MSKIGGELGDGSSAQTSAVTSQSLKTNLDELDLNDLVIETSNLCFTYNRKKGNLLDKISITFPRSAIYGFLGPSGCGKTTIIKLIIGQLKPQSGTITINGQPQKDPINKIPGIGVGYMPQEFALYNELTIMEILNYFGRIYGLPNDYKNKRIDFLIKFLDLPDPKRLIDVLSGGQKRRTSLAIALIHSPHLLILDEPTVGVDPMLRERIWQHLVHLSSQEKTSIMITTHYIDECQRAHVIALMRGGHLLIENTPSILLKHFQTNNLEDVFLEVCKGEEQPNRPNLPPNLAKVRAHNTKEIQKYTKKNKKDIEKIWINSLAKTTFCSRYLGLLIKNVTKLTRQKLYVFTLIISPLIAAILVCTTFGKKPFNLDVAVYNQEHLESGKTEEEMKSLKLLSKIDSQTIILNTYKTNESALNSVRNGKTFGALVIHKNFSTALTQRFIKSHLNVSDEVIRESTIQFFADTTDLMIFQAMLQTLFSAENAFRSEMLGLTLPNVSSKVLDLIISYDTPVYGSLNPEFRDFALPGMLILMAHLFSSTITTLDIVGERTAGTLNRTLVAGVGLFEILMALITVQSVILFIQTLSIFALVTYGFDIKNEGNPLLIIGMMLTQGLHGMAFGLFVSVISYDELMALELVVGVFLPFLIISGVLWPLEGMHYILRTISQFTPQTLPILCLRNVMLKGWGLQYAIVWKGFAVSFGYFIFFIILSIIFFSFFSY